MLHDVGESRSGPAVGRHTRCNSRVGELLGEVPDDVTVDAGGPRVGARHERYAAERQTDDRAS